MPQSQTTDNYSATESNNIESPNPDAPITFVTSGTLGDCFIVYCKLYDYHRRTGRNVRLIRYSRHPQHDGVISTLYSQVPFVEYELPCRPLPSPRYLWNLVDKMPAGHYYINANHDGAANSIAPDPDFIRMEPFPKYHTVSRPSMIEDGFHVGMQLHSGKPGGNYKGFALAWVGKLISAFQNQPITWHLFGTGDGYNPLELEQLSQGWGVWNHVGKTGFLEWVASIKRMTAFITLEGFAGYFAMSQRVPTYVYTPVPDATLNRTPPAWRHDNVIVDITGNWLERKVQVMTTRGLKIPAKYAPGDIAQVVQFVKTNLQTGR